MNKNKIILSIIGISLLLFVVWIFSILNNDKGETGKGSSTGNDFLVWIMNDSASNMGDVMTDFKALNPKYKNTQIKIESFSSYEDYYSALASAISKGKGPDLFVLNNNEKTSIFQDQVLGINPELISPIDFRKKYKGVFSDDLIMSVLDGEKQVEFLIGVPIGYETLGIYFNRRYIKASELTSLSGLNSIISKLKDKKPNLIPIGLGNGSTVYNAADIVTQFFMLENGVSKLADVTGPKLKQSLASYLLYGDISGNNAYNSRYSDLIALGKNNLDLFSQSETYMVVGYPRMIQEIHKKGFGKNFLLASPFPHYYSGDGATLLNYNYFVINKDSSNIDLATTVLQFLSTDSGVGTYLDTFPYYLPALLSLESDKLGEKIHPEFNMVLGDFYEPSYELKSFDKGVKNLYDREILSILDNPSNYKELFDSFRSRITCKTTKFVHLENLSSSCE
ncbi:extracellular solute-binding protein [Candidatus Gracilibacteria bacterium 28_42_T64]|nr:extracellular solute-binding protein [Candidatus Gracilibacteria bacterium 28_42_T64]